MSQGRVRRPKCGAQQHKTGLVRLGTTEMLGTGRKGKNRNVTPKTAFGGHIHLKEAEYFRCGGNLELFLKCQTESMTPLRKAVRLKVSEEEFNQID